MEKYDEWKTDLKKKERLIKKMAKLLQEGHRMLDEVCPRCDAILFLRKDVNLRYCPNCDIFLATPEELNKLDRSSINIVGEYAGGRVIEYKDKEIVAAPKLGARTKQQEAKLQVELKETQVDELKRLMYGLMVKIISKILEDIDYELGKLDIKEAFELLEFICRITKQLGVKNE